MTEPSIADSAQHNEFVANYPIAYSNILKAMADGTLQLFISQNKEIKLLLRAATSFLHESSSIRQRVWHIVNNVSCIPKCTQCNIAEVKWPTRALNKYNDYCSQSCGVKSDTRKEKYKSTSIAKYGVDNIRKSQVFKDNTRQLMLSRYGVDNVRKSDWFKDKCKKISNLLNGVDYPSQSESFRTKVRNTNRSKSGVNTPNERHLEPIIHYLEDYDWLYHQYIVLDKTALQLANELGINDTTVGRRLRMHEIGIKYNVGFSYACINWLEQIATEDNIYIQHANNVGEYCIPTTRYRADGYCKETNTIYEFHGDIWHGNLDVYQPQDTPNPYSELTAEELHTQTIQREEQIRELGYNLVVIWESEFNKGRYE